MDLALSPDPAERAASLDPPRERLAWGFPIGCGVVAAITVAVARLVAPPVLPPPSDTPGIYALSDFGPDRRSLGESGSLPMPFISPPVVTPALFVTPPAPHGARARVTAAALTVSGRLPAEVVERVLRRSRGRFRACYVAGLRSNPNLTGRIATRIVIGRDGSVSTVGNGGSDLPDGSVVSCVLRAMHGLSFPQPDAGIVTVVYPLQLAPG